MEFSCSMGIESVSDIQESPFSLANFAWKGGEGFIFFQSFHLTATGKRGRDDRMGWYEMGWVGLGWDGMRAQPQRMTAESSRKESSCDCPARADEVV
eukprot:763393-Hanusia_phi.AAC.2